MRVTLDWPAQDFFKSLELGFRGTEGDGLSQTAMNIFALAISPVCSRSYHCFVSLQCDATGWSSTVFCPFWFLARCLAWERGIVLFIMPTPETFDYFLVRNILTHSET